MNCKDIVTISDNTEEVTRHYYLKKAEVPADEILKMPPYIQKIYKEKGPLEKYISVRYSRDMKNVFVGHKIISLKEYGQTITVKSELDSHIALKDGKIYGSTKNDLLINVLFEELGCYQKLCTPIGDTQPKPQYTMKYITKVTLKQILSGKIRTREQLLVSYLKTSLKITTVRATTFEKWEKETMPISLQKLQAVVGADKLELAMLRILKGNLDTRPFMALIDLATVFNTRVDPTADIYTLAGQYLSLLRKGADMQEKYGLIKESPDQHPLVLQHMRQITSEKEKYVLENIMGTSIKINPTKFQQVPFIYEKDNQFALVRIDIINYPNFALHAPTWHKTTDFNLIRQSIERTLKKNRKAFAKLIESFNEQTDDLPY